MLSLEDASRPTPVVVSYALVRSAKPQPRFRARPSRIVRGHGTAVRQEFCLNERTTLILLVSRISRLTWTRKGINAVRHTNSVFHDILKLVPWAAFDRLVDGYGTDEAARRFTTRNQFLVLLFAQFGGASSLREVEAVMASHQARLYHVGAKAPKGTVRLSAR